MVAVVRSWWLRHPLVAWGAIALVALVIVVAQFVMTAVAASEDLLPNGVSAINRWVDHNGSVADADIVAALRFSSQPGDERYIVHSNRNQGGSVTLTLDDPIPLGMVVQQVDIDVVARSTAGRSLSLTPVRAGVDGTTHAINGMTTTFATYPLTNVARPGGGAWTVADLVGLETRLETPAPGANNTYVDVDQVVVRVTYQVAPTLTVSRGTDDLPAGSRPAEMQYALPGSEDVVIDQIVLEAESGSGAVGVTEVRVRGRDTAPQLDADVAAVRLYRDNGSTPGQFDATDTLLGSGVFGGAAGDGSVWVAFTGAPLLTVADGATVKLWIVYDLAEGANDGNIVGSRLVYSATMADSDIQVESGHYVNAFGTIQSDPGATGETIYIDATAPSVAITDPGNGVVLTGTEALIEGTAFDAGSGVASVEVSIARSDSTWYDRATETFDSAGEPVWNLATGTEVWEFPWTLAPPDDRDYTYVITARATDGLGQSGSSDGVTVQVDNVGPSIVSAQAMSSTTVDVLLSEPLDPATVGPGDFSIAGLAISGVELLAGNDRVRLTTEEQASGLTYTVTTYVGAFFDPYGNQSVASSADFLGIGGELDEEPPTIPGNLQVTPGSIPPVIAVLTWDASTDNVGVAGYRIYRSAAEEGEYAQIGQTANLTFSDTSGVPGEEYWYKVRAFDAANNMSPPTAPAGPIAAEWIQVPHAQYSSTTNLCTSCHALHDAALGSKILRPSTYPSASLGVCYLCHDGTGSSTDILAGPVNSFALASGHTLEGAGVGGDLTDDCGGCHNPHRDYATNRMLPGRSVNGVAVTEPDNSWCLACHNDTNDWYGPGYPDLAEPSRDASGYPVLGTFPGASVYDTEAANAHARIPTSTLEPRRVEGDCLYCHASHRAENAYDGLLQTFVTPTAETYIQDQLTGDFAELCFGCHGTRGNYAFPTPPAGAMDIQQFYTAGGSRSGHRIKTAGGNLPAGAPMPCYNCHNPHGSSRGNASLLSDERGQGLDTSTPQGVRAFCFTCHSSSDATPMVWDSGTGVYVPAGTDSIEGLRRDGSMPAGNVVRLPDINGHAVADPQSCYACHGANYGVGGNNVHDPGAGVSAGGQDCFSCHALQDMQSGATYHHYVSSDSSASYPMVADPSALATDDARRTCLMCHVDHDFFNPSNTEAAHTGGLAQNFRASVAVAPDMADASTYVNYDFSDLDAGDGGVCVSCHKAQMPKNSTGRKSDTDRSAMTVPVTREMYGLSAHNYFATGEDLSDQAAAAIFESDNSGFKVNCGKCHNDTLEKQFQSGVYQFGLHDSTIEAMLTDGGFDPFPARPGESLCYLCHSRSTDAAPNNPLGGATYGAPGSDMYGGGLMMGQMNTDALNIKGMYSGTGIVSSHPVGGAGGSRVACENCHNPHKTEAALGWAGPSGVVQDPYNTLVGSMTDGSHVYYVAPADGAEFATNRDFCMACHNGTQPAYVNNGTAYVPSDVEIAPARAALANKSTYLGRSHANALAGETAPGAATIEQSCDSCHDKHGSRYPAMLGRANSPDEDPTIAGSVITGNNNTVCAACHTSATADYPAAVLDASGYPVRGTFPGMGVYAGANGIHKGTDVVWPLSTYAGGDCKNCHDVHGTANVYDQLRAGFRPNDFAMCFECHDGSITSAMNIKRYFPATNGGTPVQGAGTNFGHRIQTAGGNLTPGDGLPCYSCHNPHGTEHAAYGLLVVSENAGATIVIGDEAGEIDLSSAAGVRRFCFSCHTSSDATPQGTAGTGGGYVAITGVARVQGISRTAAAPLRLPVTSGHYIADTESCYGCHGNDYSSDTSNNVHNPGAGGSSGGLACDGCHADIFDVMLDDTDTYHHVLDGADPGMAPGATSTYPTSKTELACVSCHTDHNYFNDTKAANLRESINDPTGARSDTDFIENPAKDYGICVSCHETALDKNITGQKNPATTGGSVRTPAIDGAEYSASSHNYDVTSAFGDNSTFKANCVKCHNDGMTGGSYQISPFKFGLHYSAENRLILPVGVTIVSGTTSTEENLCLACHSGAGPLDLYGAVPMTAASRDIARQLAQSSAHNVTSAAWAGRHTADEYDTAPASVSSVSPGGPGWWGPNNQGIHVECEDCHNPHASSADALYTFPNGANADTGGFNVSAATRGNSAVPISSANAGVWGVDINGSSNGLWNGSNSPPVYSKIAEAEYEWQLCLKCHTAYAWGNNTPPATESGQKRATTTARTTRVAGNLTDVGQDFDPNQLAYHPLFAVGRNQPTVAYGPWTTNAQRRQGVTHLSHTFVDGWLSTSLVTCSDCHGSESWSVGTADGPHGSSYPWILRGLNTGIKVTIANGTVVSPNATGPAGNFCLNCHRADVYGYGTNSAPDTTAALLSRVNHQSGFMRSQCNDGATAGYLPVGAAGCFMCHGGRHNDNVQSLGSLHGTSMGRGDGVATALDGQDAQNGPLIHDEMGKRFMNGVGWDAHQLGDVSGNVGCFTIDTANTYSGCTNHSGTGGRTNAPHYYYPWQ